MRYLILLCCAFVYYLVQFIKAANAAYHGHIRFLRGIPELIAGTDVSINLNEDRIIISNELVIPFEQVKKAAAFQIRQISLPGNKDSIRTNMSRFGKYALMLRSILTAKKMSFFSVDYTNKQGEACNGLFITDNFAYVKRMADRINR